MRFTTLWTIVKNGLSDLMHITQGNPLGYGMYHLHIKQKCFDVSNNFLLDVILADNRMGT